jgi:hypothetical protein
VSESIQNLTLEPDVMAVAITNNHGLNLVLVNLSATRTRLQALGFAGSGIEVFIRQEESGDLVVRYDEAPAGWPTRRP